MEKGEFSKPEVDPQSSLQRLSLGLRDKYHDLVRGLTTQSFYLVDEFISQPIIAEAIEKALEKRGQRQREQMDRFYPRHHEFPTGIIKIG